MQRARTICRKLYEFPTLKDVATPLLLMSAGSRPMPADHDKRAPLPAPSPDSNDPPSVPAIHLYVKNVGSRPHE